MLSRRDMLLIQPWEQRRYKDHRSKVANARAAVDSSAPAQREHVAAKRKRRQRESERQTRAVADNFSLLQRLVATAVARSDRVDHRWRSALPNLHQKVGVYIDTKLLASRVSSVPSVEPASARYRCYACHVKQQINPRKKSHDYNRN